MLENTRRRFAKDRIYTLVGEILLAVNPFKEIAGLYSEEVRVASMRRRRGAEAQRVGAEAQRVGAEGRCRG